MTADGLENFLRLLQNSHFQGVLMAPLSALTAYPELSDRHLRPEKWSGWFLGQKKCSSQIVYVSSNDNSSAQRVLESWNWYHSNHLEVRILNMSLIFSSISVNETAIQNVWKNHFSEPGGGAYFGLSADFRYFCVTRAHIYRYIFCETWKDICLSILAFWVIYGQISFLFLKVTMVTVYSFFYILCVCREGGNM